MYYLNYFFIFSIIGHFLETFVYPNGESGILYGYWTPVYGVGVVFILFVYNFINKKWSLSKVTKFFIIFFIGAICLSLIEALGGYLIEWIFHIVFWDYSNYKLNIGKYCAVEMAIIWGLCSILIIYFLKPLFDKIVKYIPKFSTICLCTLFVVDLIYTLNLK